MRKTRDWARCMVLAAPLWIANYSPAQQPSPAQPSSAAQQNEAAQRNSAAQSSGAGQTASAAPGGAAPVLPAHPATAEQIREYLALTNIVNSSQRSMQANVEAMQATAAPFYPADFWSDMKSSLQQLDLVELYTPVLQRYLSQEDMAAMLSFYRSPAGKAFLSVQPTMASAAETALRAKGSEVGQEVVARHKDEIAAARKKYEADHAGAAK